jgi:hypothetical protein
MPDIQTALSNALKTTINNWEKDDMQTTQTNTQTQGKKFFGVTNNVTRATFDYLKKNPNLTSAEICADMEKLGYKESSVGSLIAQFAKQGLAERDDRGRYITIVPEYRPLKAKKKILTIVPKPVEAKRKYEKRSEGIAALQPDASEMPAPKRFVTLVRTKSPDDILKDMTVFQARELYDYLKKMFGG